MTLVGRVIDQSCQSKLWCCSSTVHVEQIVIVKQPPRPTPRPGCHCPSFVEQPPLATYPGQPGHWPKLPGRCATFLGRPGRCANRKGKLPVTARVAQKLAMVDFLHYGWRCRLAPVEGRCCRPGRHHGPSHRPSCQSKWRCCSSTIQVEHRQTYLQTHLTLRRPGCRRPSFVEQPLATHLG